MKNKGQLIVLSAILTLSENTTSASTIGFALVVLDYFDSGVGLFPAHMVGQSQQGFLSV